MPASAFEPKPRTRRAEASLLLRRMVGRTVSACLRYRVGGLAAEIAFFGMLALPPLIFGLAGVVGFIAGLYPVTTVASFQAEVLAFAERFLTEDAVTQLIAPTLAEVLGGARFDVISIGFLIALWSGSRAMSVVVDTITIMYGMAEARGWLRQRLFSFGLYVIFVFVGALIVPLVLAGPRVVNRLLPEPLEWLARGYWPVVTLATMAVLSTLYHAAVPVRERWVGAIPGAVFTLLMWLAGSSLLRWAMGYAIGSSSIFGPLATPIALMAWLYLVAIAILIGAALNAAVATVWPELAGFTQSMADRVLSNGSGRPDATQRASKSFNEDEEHEEAAQEHVEADRDEVADGDTDVTAVQERLPDSPTSR